MITNINKAKYIDLVENLKRDRRIINKALPKLNLPKVRGTIVLGKSDEIEPEEIKVLSRFGNGEYIIRSLKKSGKTITTVYSKYQDYVVVWPMEVIQSGKYDNNPYIIFIKQHLIQRYIERYLKTGENLKKGLPKFIDVFCMRENPVMIRKHNSDLVDSLTCRIKEGVLLGYSYKINPGILRFNTFVSDKELEETNREDQKSVRIGGVIWKKVVQ